MAFYFILDYSVLIARGSRYPLTAYERWVIVGVLALSAQVL